LDDLDHQDLAHHRRNRKGMGEDDSRAVKGPRRRRLDRGNSQVPSPGPRHPQHKDFTGFGIDLFNPFEDTRQPAPVS